VGVFLGYASARGHALVDRALYLPYSWSDDSERCQAAGVPDDQWHYQSKTDLALRLLRQARQRGHLDGQWVTADEDYGKVPGFRDALDAEGWWYVLEVSCTTQVFTQAVQTAVREWVGNGRPPTKTRLAEGEPGPTAVEILAAQLPDTAQELTVAEGAQDHAHSRQPMGLGTPRGRPGRLLAGFRRNLTARAQILFSNAPADTPLLKLGQVGAMRWVIETEFQTYKGEAGLDEYEARSWQSWYHHITMAMLAGAFLLTLQQDWGGKDAPDHPAADHSSATATAAAAQLDPRRFAALAGRHPRAQPALQTQSC
jgi:SRSO17 transposase